MSDTDNVQLIAKFFNSMNAGNYEEAISFLSEDAVWMIPSSIPGGGPKTREGFLEVLNGFKPLFAKPLQYAVLSNTVQDDRVATQVRGVADLKNGKHYDNAYCFAFKIKDGKISSAQEYMDSHYALQVVMGA